MNHHRISAESDTAFCKASLKEASLAGPTSADQSACPATPEHTTSQRRAWEGSQVRVQLADFLPVILQAAVDRSRWLEDFASEPVLISRDFHEVLSNFNAIRTQQRRAG